MVSSKVKVKEIHRIFALLISKVWSVTQNKKDSSLWSFLPIVFALLCCGLPVFLLVFGSVISVFFKQSLLTIVLALAAVGLTGYIVYQSDKN
jgi:hypothetical protein